MKCKTLICVIFIVVFIFYGCAKNATSNTSQIEELKAEDFQDILEFEPDFNVNNFPEKYESKRAILMISKGYMTKDEKISLGNSIDRTVDKLEAYLGASLEKLYPNEKKIIYFIEPGTLTRMRMVKKPVILLSDSGGMNSLYAHETVHLLAGKQMGSLWIVEGLAVYLNERFSEINSWPYYHNDIHETAKKYLKLENKTVLDLIGQDNNFPFYLNPRNSDGEAYYALSGSFVKFLDDKIGIKKLLEIYKRSDISYASKEITTKDIAEWKKEWLNLLGAPKDINS